MYQVLYETVEVLWLLKICKMMLKTLKLEEILLKNHKLGLMLGFMLKNLPMRAEFANFLIQKLIKLMIKTWYNWINFYLMINILKIILPNANKMKKKKTMNKN